MSVNQRPLRYAHSEGHTDLCYTEDGRQMITCGNDGDIRLWAGIDDTDPESYCVGESAFSVAQKGDDIFVCIDDGRVMILKYPEGERNGSLTRFTAPANHITVAKDDTTIACVSEDFSVKLFNSPQDTDCVTFSDLQGPALGVAISPDNNLLAASCGDGKLYIWKILEKKLVKSIECVPRCNSFTSAKVLCRMSFDPKSKYIAYPDANNVIVASTDKFEKVFSLSSTEVDSPFSIVQFSPCGRYIAASTTKGDICFWQCQPNSRAVVSNHEQKYNICALAWNPESNGEISFCDVNGQIGTLDYTSGLEDDIPIPNIIDDDDDDNENVISLEKIRNETLGLRPDSPTNLSSGAASRAQSPERPSSPPCTLQPPFQPGSTPGHLKQRFMAFNDVGIVRLHEDEDDGSSIDVQFHDATHFKNIYMKNGLNHTMASLSTAVLALACESKLVCMPLISGTKEWSTTLSDLEEILCIAASSSFIAVASNDRMLRIFSIFGSQCAVLSIPGPVLSMAAHKKFIFVVYYACTAHSKDHNLAGLLIHLEGSSLSSKTIPVPITPRSNLTWVGFTDVGSLATYDSGSILRICRLESGAWVPAFDATVHATGVDTYFMIHASESSQTVRVIHCKSTVYPAAVPLPLLLELPMQVPMCELETDKTQLEEKLFRWSYFETDQPEKSFKETAIKLFALACRNNLDDRAYELMELLNTPQLVNIALKYANKLGRARMVQRLSDLSRRLNGEDEANNENNPSLSVRPTINRPNKSRTEPTNVVEAQSQQIFTPDIFSGNSMVEDSQMKDDVMIQKTNQKNPFLKNANSDQKRNPLSLTNTTDDYVPPEVNSGKTQLNTKPEKSVGKVSQTNTKVVEKESFKSWFSKEKAVLEQEHPEMDAADLVKFALKLFKKQAEKRKASDDADNSQKSKQPKLSAFAFSKSN